MKKIMVVDDDPGLRDAFQIIFRSGTCQLSVLPSAEILLTDNFTKPDLIILDRLLAGADGLDVCRSLKSRAATRDIPVLMLSATPDILNAALEAGANESIAKPFRLKDLRAAAFRLMM